MGGTGGGVVVIAATNRLEDLDEAIIRRFDSKVFVGNPEREARRALLVTFLSGVSTGLSEPQVGDIIDKTNGWSGSDIEILCRSAKNRLGYYLSAWHV